MQDRTWRTICTQLRLFQQFLFIFIEWVPNSQMYLRCRWEVQGGVIKRLRRWLKLCITNEVSSSREDQQTTLYTIGTRDFGLWRIGCSTWKMHVSADNIIATLEFASIAVYYFKSLSSRCEICSVWPCLFLPHLPYSNLLGGIKDVIYSKNILTKDSLKKSIYLKSVGAEGCQIVRVSFVALFLHFVCFVLLAVHLMQQMFPCLTCVNSF